MAKGTCKTDECERRVFARGLCGAHYQRCRTAGTLEDVADPSAFAEYHRITDPDPQTKTGTCSICGPVEIHVRTNRPHQCLILRRAQRRKAAMPRQRFSGSMRKRVAQSRYRMTDAEMDALLARANGACEICDDPIDFELDAQVDHCHATGAVRGLLCKSCNFALGWLRDDPQRALAAHLYLTAQESRRRA